MWRPRFHFALPVWGEAYVDLFLRATLPCLLARGNLGDFRWASGSVFKIYTRAVDAERLGEQRAFRRLQSLIETRIVPIDDLMAVRQANFARFTDCQRMAVETSDAADAALFFLGPDFLLNDGMISTVAERIVAGRAAVMIEGNRVIKSDVLPIVEAKTRRGHGALALELTGRELVGMALGRLHPQSRAWFWDAPNFDRLPPYLHFRAGDAGFVSAGYVLHPMAVRSRVKNVPILNIWDQDWLAAACPDPGEIEVATDSDVMTIFGLDEAERFADYLVPNAASVDAVAYFAEWTFSALHRDFGRRLARFKAKDGDPAIWAEAEILARATVEQIAERLAQDDDTVMAQDPKRMLVRLRARYRYADRSLYNPPYAADTGEIGNALAEDLPRLLEVASPADRERLIVLARARGLAV
jgi:hypothetical protein